jgi:hypothetical protein
MNKAKLKRFLKTLQETTDIKGKIIPCTCPSDVFVEFTNKRSLNTLDLQYLDTFIQHNFTTPNKFSHLLPKVKVNRHGDLGLHLGYELIEKFFE